MNSTWTKAGARATTQNDGKPAPDMFLLAAKKMGVPPEKCLVFEDAEPGMRAADEAGTKYERVPSRKAKKS